ncbi:MAG: VTT domain-containing protein [Anaerolineales bacterium]|nr:VTT domain-containing protein [Anaerolineales bacterium]
MNSHNPTLPAESGDTPGRARPRLSGKRLLVVRIVVLILVITMSVFVFLIRDQAQRLAVYGYPGIFLISFLAYATVLLPAPGVAVVFTMGAVFNPVGVALAAGLGATVGELTGYLAGFSGQAVVERIDLYDQLVYWLQRYGPVVILALSAVPNPFFDIAGVVAGTLKMPVRAFLFWCWLGETLKMFVFAFAGANLFRLAH